jgi:hypothetical protein
MKVGNLAVIVWTDGCETPPIMGLITTIDSPTPDPTRQLIHLLTDASHLWLERGELRVVS